MKIINNLKGIRTQRKIAQKQLAMDTGYDPRTIRRVELGECCPSAEFMFDMHIKHEFCGRTAFAQLNAADSAGIISSVHGKLLLGDFSLCPYSLKIINYFHSITSFIIIH